MRIAENSSGMSRTSESLPVGISMREYQQERVDMPEDNYAGYCMLL